MAGVSVSGHLLQCGAYGDAKHAVRWPKGRFTNLPCLACLLHGTRTSCPFAAVHVHGWSLENPQLSARAFPPKGRGSLCVFSAPHDEPGPEPLRDVQQLLHLKKERMMEMEKMYLITFEDDVVFYGPRQDFGTIRWASRRVCEPHHLPPKDAPSFSPPHLSDLS